MEQSPRRAAAASKVAASGKFQKNLASGITGIRSDSQATGRAEAARRDVQDWALEGPRLDVPSQPAERRTSNFQRPTSIPWHVGGRIAKGPVPGGNHASFGNGNGDLGRGV